MKLLSENRVPMSCSCIVKFMTWHRKVELCLQGAVVFAGCVKAQEGGAKELKDLNLKRLHVIQLDVTSDEQVATATDYVSRHIPPQGDFILM